MHRLQELKGLAVDSFSHSEVLYSDEKPTLTFAGLARIVRHVIFTFVLESTKRNRESYNWQMDLPNIIRMRMDPAHWIWNPENYVGSTATIWLEAFLEQLSNAVICPSAKVNDLHRILEKIETMNLAGLKAAERRSVLTLYFLCALHTGPNSFRPRRFWKGWKQRWRLLRRRDWRYACSAI